METNKKEFKNDPVDQANLDLHFVEAFIDMLSELARDNGTLETLNTSTIAAMCFESRFKIESLKGFIESIPVKTVKAAA